METKINGIIIEGKVYEAVECDEILNHCDICDLYRECSDGKEIFPCPWAITEGRSYFRYSQSLTDKLNNYGNHERPIRQ